MGIRGNFQAMNSLRTSAIFKVAFFHPYFRFGGVEKTNIRLAKYFIEHGYSVEFVSLGYTEHFVKEMDEIGISKVQLKATRTFFAIPQLKAYIKSQIQEAKKQGKRFVLISCQNFANLCTVLATPMDCRNGKCKNFKLILSERLHPAEFQYSGKGKKGKIILRLMRLLYKKADAVVANSRETAEEIERITGSPCRYIYNPTLTGDLQKLAEQEVNQEWLKKDCKNPVVISVGRLSKEKGFDILIKAFSRIQKELDARLVIIGEGEERASLEELAESLGIKDKVWMPGYDENPYKYVSKADVFVLSSFFEGLPNTLIEALAVGTGCVATRCPSGPSEILLDGQGGLLVDVGDTEGLAMAIKEALKDDGAMQEKQRRAMEALHRFTPQEAGEKYLELINE